mgnify:CR=1 FL=1
MLRKIITIDQEKCNGCGLCAQACHEQAIGMVDGKAALLRDDYCDGLGDCLPVCPTNAITFEVREAAAYDEAAVLANKASQEAELPCGCPGTRPVYCISRNLHQRNRQPRPKTASCSNGLSRSSWSTRTHPTCKTAGCWLPPTVPPSHTAISTVNS